MSNAEISDEFRRFFKLSNSPVAITVHSREINGGSPDETTRFCRFVREVATLRKTYVIREENLSNFTSRVIFGFMEPKYADIYPRIKPSETKAVTLKPLELEKGRPDVVVLISNPSTLMEVLQVYNKASGKRLESSCSSSGSAIAGEATALPYMEDRPNVTLLCGGARSIGGFKEDELAMGFPYTDFSELTRQLSEPDVTDALCGCVMDDLPDHLIEAFEEMNFDKSTDHFHGYYRDRALRLYLNQDDSGSFNELTVYLPIKYDDEDMAKKAKESVKSSVTGGGFARTRGNWLDLGAEKRFDEGLEKIAMEKGKFEESMKKFFDGFLRIVDNVEDRTK